MHLSISSNFPDVQRKLAALQKDIADKVLASALNKTVALAKTRMQREITAEFNVTTDYVRERLRITKASANGRFGISASLIGNVLLQRGQLALYLGEVAADAQVHALAFL